MVARSSTGRTGRAKTRAGFYWQIENRQRGRAALFARLIGPRLVVLRLTEHYPKFHIPKFHIIDKSSDQEYKDGVLSTDRFFTPRFFTLTARLVVALKKRVLTCTPILQYESPLLSLGLSRHLRCLSSCFASLCLKTTRLPGLGGLGQSPVSRVCVLPNFGKVGFKRNRRFRLSRTSSHSQKIEFFLVGIIHI